MFCGIAALAVAFGSIGQAKAVQLIGNGDFETGSFSAWTVGSTQVNPFQAVLNDGNNAQIVNSVSGQPAWFLRNKPANYFGTPATPITNFSAFNGFDGSPGFFFLRQAFSVTDLLSSALLNFDYAVQSTYSGLPRVFTANILDLSNTQLANVFSYTRPVGPNIAWSPTAITTDIAGVLNGLGMGTYQLEFRIDIPQNFTGAAQFAIDNIALNATPVPEPGTWMLMGTGLVGLLGYGWRRRKA
jgi:hypothetical protein